MKPEESIGHYSITALLGKGGMGEVYRARDTKLDREVALKILPDAFAGDPGRMARFEREAQVLASLNHPNIAAIYGIEQSAIVMELVEGEELRGPLPLKTALDYARQIAAGLEVAHEKGIVHRDLKPANIMITPSGAVKVLDFGLAKAADASTASSDPTIPPTVTMSRTRAGVILGTAGYMAPEQARGKTVDQRADIWAFGVVLYEMLTGKQAFTGETVTDVLASVVKEQPPLHPLPAPVRMIVERCLQKDPRQRWQSIGDVRVLIEALLADPGKLPETEVRIAAKPLWKRAIPVAAAAILASAITGGIAIWALRPIPATIVRFSAPLGEGQVFTNTGRRDVAISPDGTEIAYVANDQLYLRRMAELDARPIPGSQDLRGVPGPVFSPNGQSIAYWATSEGALKRIAPTGGAITVLPFGENPAGISWDSSGIVFSQASHGVMRISPDGGKPELLATAKDGEYVAFPQMLPGGEAVMFTSSRANQTDSESGQIIAETLKSGVRKTLVQEGSDGRYVPTGHLVYALGGSLYAVPFDVRRLEVKGAAVPIIEGVKRFANTRFGVAQFDFSSTGSLIYIPGPAVVDSRQYSIGLLGLKGDVEFLKLPPQEYSFPRVTHDGKKLAYEIEDGKNADVWVYDLSASNAPRRLTFQGANRYPVWSADGERVAFQSDREGDFGIFWQRADGTGAAERLTKPEKGVALIPTSFSPDGRQLSFTALTSNNTSSVWTLSLGDRRATLFADGGSNFAEDSAFSPDGRWLSYSVDTVGGGGDIIYVQPFPLTPAKYQISQGHDAIWSQDGKQLIFDSGPGRFAAVNVTTQGGFAFSSPIDLPRRGLGGGPNGPQRFDILPDGRMVGVFRGESSQADTTAPQIRVVLNWFEELKRRAPTH